MWWKRESSPVDICLDNSFMRVTQFSLQFVLTQLLIIAAATVGANDESFLRVWLTRKAFDHLVAVGGRVMNAIIPDIRVSLAAA